MTVVIQSLIESNAAWEDVRDQISNILAIEEASQVALATANGSVDPTQWAFNVYEERSNPWEVFRDDAEVTPIVNVWYDSSTSVERTSGHAGKQTLRSVFNVDCYAGGITTKTDDGQDPGDKRAATNVQRIARLAMKILMADTYMYLGLKGTVGRRALPEIKAFQPQVEGNALHVAAIRLRFEVDHNELTVEYEPTTLDMVTVEVTRQSDGLVFFNGTYDYS